MAPLVRREWSDLQDLVQRFFEGEAEKSWLRVEEFADGDTLVVRAELPDIDPEKDVDISVADGKLHIKAEREVKTEHKDKGSFRSEFRYGSFVRTVTLPAGATETDVTAAYKDGVLEIRVPVSEPVQAAPAKIPITRG